MKYLDSKLNKIFSTLTIAVMVLNLFIAPLSLYAQETTPEPTQESTSSTIETGDSTSQASSENIANVNTTQVEGNVEGGSCGVDVSVSCPVETTNDAQVAQDTSSQSVSGENGAEVQGESNITTGDSTASSTSENILNVNVIEATGEATPEAGIENQDANEANIDIQNDVSLETNTSAEGTSGENTNSADETSIDTGDSVALANQFNLLNANIIGSNFSFIIIDILDYFEGDLDLNSLWLVLQEYLLNPNGTDAQTDVTLENNANLDVYSQATSISGENASEGDETSIDTGNALAISNILNIVNLNVIGSTFFLPIINIFGTLNGNIILPSGERFSLTPQQNQIGGEIDITNIVQIESEASSDALSGENDQEGMDLGLTTGDALSQASSTNYLNLNILQSNWYRIFINNFGLWLGGNQDGFSELIVEDSSNPEDLAGGENNDGSNIQITNIAYINAISDALAVSGGNQTKSYLSMINTGWARSLSNIFNLVNTNIIGSNFMLPIITVFNAWQGDVEYAYPDLSIVISADKNTVKENDTITYNVSFENKGTDVAKNANIQTVLPEGETYTNGDSRAQSSGRVINLSLGTVNPGVGGSFSFQSNLRRPNPSTTEFTTLTYITSSDIESDNSNNSSSATKKLETGDATTSNKSPRLELWSTNNVNEFVYSGDTVTFEVDVKNTGEGTSKDTIVYQTVVDESGQEVSYNEFALANINPSNKTNISFGIRIPDQAPSGTYASYITAEGKGDDGSTISSNTSQTSVPVRGRFFSFAGGVEALETNVKSGFNQQNTQKENQATNNYWPNILAALLVGAWLIDINKRRIAPIIAKRRKK